MADFKTQAAQKLQFILQAEPGQWSFLFGNGINRHEFGNDCRWDILLQQIGGVQSNLTNDQCMNEAAFNDIYNLVCQNDVVIKKKD